jgi:hypothetical protein
MRRLVALAIPFAAWLAAMAAILALGRASVADGLFFAVAALLLAGATVVTVLARERLRG